MSRKQGYCRVEWEVRRADRDLLWKIQTPESRCWQWGGVESLGWH